MRLGVAEIGLVRRTLGKVMGDEVISTETGTTLVPLLVRKRDIQRQTVRDRG